MEASQALSFVETGGSERFAEDLRELEHLDSTLGKREEEEDASQEAAADENARFAKLLLIFRAVLATTNYQSEALTPTSSALENIALRLKWGQEVDVAELDALIAMTRDVECALAPEPKKKLAWNIAMLGQILLIHHTSQQNAEDLNAAIAALHRARELDPDEPDHVRLLIRALGSRARAIGKPGDFDEAIELASRFAASEDIPNRDEFASLQERYSFLRFMQSRGEGELDSFLAMSRKLSPAGVGELSTFYRAVALEERYNHSGEFYDLGLAISLYASLLEGELTGIDRLTVLDCLAWSYTRRFLEGGPEKSDIDKAIALTTRALSALDSDTPARRDHILALALRYTWRARADWHDARTDLDKATELFRSVKRPDEPDTLWYQGYAECLRRRFQLFDDTAALHERVSVLEECARLFAEHEGGVQQVLLDLALAQKDALWSDANRRLHDPEARGLLMDFWCSRAKKVMKTFVDADKSMHPHAWLELSITAEFSKFYAESILFMHSRDRAVDLMDPDVVRDLQSRFLDRMSEAMGLGHSLSRRYELAATRQSTVSATVASAFLLGQNDTALKWFEQGRAVVWSQIQSLRTPLDDLRLKRPDLADELEKLSLELERTGRRAPLPLQPSAGIFGSAQVDANSVAGRSLAREHKALLERIRALDEFKTFLRPKGADTLLKAAASRAVACINVHASRCDALIILDAKMHHVQLPSRVPDLVTEWRAKLAGYLRGERARAIDDHRNAEVFFDTPEEGDIRGVLSEMWDHVVWPILKVYLENLKQGHRAHITWCTTGELAFLPLHAAGPYNGESPNTFDLVVSSYAPNLSSLPPPATVPEPVASPSILVVAQPDTPGVRSLPKTKEELEKIKERFKDTDSEFLLGPQGTVLEVLNLMAKHPYIHLACHGRQDRDPMNSAFILHPGLPDRKALVPDGKALVPDGKTPVPDGKAPLPDGALTLHSLMAHKSSNAQLAFLSACETAMGDEMVPDEAVHLAAGMLAAGYKSVVATMWSIGDSEAASVADEFYKAFLPKRAPPASKGTADPKPNPDPESVPWPDAEGNAAIALHWAVHRLRKRVRADEFVKWMPFIHLGQ